MGMDYHDWLTEIDEREYEADNAAALLALLALLYGLLVAAADTREVPDGNEEWL